MANKKSTSKPAFEEIPKAPEQVSDDIQIQVTISKSELETLHAAARLFDLLEQITAGGTCDTPIESFAVLFELVSGPTWTVFSELQDRFEAAGGQK
jgi:hypothetical protein